MGEVVSYANAVRAAVGPGAHTDLLVQAAGAIEAARDGQEFDEALTQWKAARRELEQELAAYVAGPLADVEQLRKQLLARFDDEAGLRLDLPFGPVRVAIDVAAVVAEAPGAPGRRVGLGPRQPSTFRSSLEAGVASGGGVLELLPDGGFRGGFAVDLEAISATALASLLRTPGREPSFLAVVGVEFNPPVQLSFGFSLDRVGGLVGVNRRADVTLLAALLRSGAAGDVLFPSDPIRDAPRLLASLDHLFPLADGAAIVGPTLRLSWLSIGGTSFFSFDLGVLVELPGPRIFLVGVARAGIQGVLGLRLDVLGVIDVPGRLTAVDATLVDSRALGIFVLTGDAAFRLHWADPAYSVLSIGGFYPGFRPEPASVPPLTRVAMTLDQPISGITLRAEGYVAVTPNTVQLGGQWEAGLAAGPVSATGFLAVDALVQFTPFHVHAEVAAGFRVRVFGSTFAGVRLDGVIDGPGPVVISGRLTVETFLFDISWSETFMIPPANPPPADPPPVLADVVAAQAIPANLSTGGNDPLVQLAPTVSTDASVLVPGGALEWHQCRAPLGTPVTRVDGRPLGRQSSVTVTPDGAAAGFLPQQFAPGQLTELTAAEALNGPTFEDMPAGLRVHWADDDFGAAHSGNDSYLTFRKLPSDWSPHPGANLPELPASVLHMILTSYLAEVTDRAAVVTVTQPTWATTTGSIHDSAYAARQAARTGGGAVVPATDLEAPVDLTAVLG